MRKWKRPLRYLLSVAMVSIGVGHFLAGEQFAASIPKLFPAPLLLVYVSGVFEILGGVGLQVARARRFSAWGLVALYVAVYPANLNLAINYGSLAVHSIPRWLLICRLPIQPLLMAWAWWYTRPDHASD